MLTPLVVGPQVVPIVTDEADAMDAPELAVLSVLAHGRDEPAEAIGRAVLAAAARLDDARGALYADLTLAMVHEAARRALEAMMANGTYEYQSEFARKYFGDGVAQGVAQGEARGLLRGKAEALLGVLAARGIPVSAEVRERVMTCTDLTVLDAWLTRAATASSAAEALGE